MITNSFLSEVAKAVAGESFVTPAYFAFGSDVITPNEASTSLSGEEGSRSSASDSRSANVVTFSGTRSGAAVASSDGDVLNSVGVLDTSSSGTLLSEHSLSSIVHTTRFDIVVDYELSVDRV